MEGIIEEQIVADIIRHEDKLYGEKTPNVPVSRSQYILCHLVFLLLGVCHLIPISFLGAANNFWMHTFRNVTDPDQSAENRTYLQKNFASATLIVSAFACLFFGIFNITHGNRFKIRNRLILTLAIELVVFVLLTISVKVDTDNFQLPFFILVLLANSILSGANTVNMVASMNLYPRFPHMYMKTTLIGEGCAGIVGDVLNIAAVFLFNNDIVNATLTYFICGTAIIFFTLVLTVVISKTDFFTTFLNTMPLSKEEKKVPSMRELLRVSYNIRFVLSWVLIFVIGFTACHTSVTALVVSEQSTTTSSWAKNYFSPVMTFLLSDIGLLIGTMMSSYMPIKIPELLFTILATARTLILIPLIWLCNAQPRSHLAVLFPHDYQYGVILLIFMITSGYIANTSALYIAEKVVKHEVDMAFTLYGLVLNIIQTLSSPIGLFIVNVL